MNVDRFEVLAVLEPYFQEMRARFVEFAQRQRLSSIEKTVLEVDPKRPHLIGVARDGGRIYVIPELIELPEDTVRAFFAHGFGHVVDVKNPGRFFGAEDELVLVDHVEDDELKLARMRRWTYRSSAESELVADGIAKEVTGSYTGYSGDCLR